MMTMMGKRLLGAVATGLLALAACSSDPAGVDEMDLLDDEVIDLVPDYAISSAAVIDGGGIGGARLPEELRLTDEQKAEIAALHEAFIAEHADEVAALREIEQQLRDLRRDGGTLDERRALHEQAAVILESLAADFAALQEAIWAVYTDAQRAWIETHRPRVCRPGERPDLTEEQIAQIRALQQAFHEAMADEIAAIKAAHEAARAAHQAGATREEIAAILATVQDEIAELRAAEAQLWEDIQAVLTDEQREDWCIVRRHVRPPHRG
jgi:hypothetical protein